MSEQEIEKEIQEKGLTAPRITPDQIDAADCPNERLVILQNAIQKLRDLTQVQCNDGNWNYDPYMHGMANGMILALSLFEAGEPKYLDEPAEWLKDRASQPKVSEASAT